MDHELRRSRPIRAAAAIAGIDEAEAFRRFDHARVVITLADDLARDRDAHETFLFAVNQVLRFCANVGISVPTSAPELVARARLLSRAIVAADATLVTCSPADGDVTLAIGADVVHDRPAITVNSTGWVARLATSETSVNHLPDGGAKANPLGALGAASLGTGQVFRFLAGQRLADAPTEISLFARTQGAPGALDPGPPLPRNPLHLDALLVGCGGVMHGFAYTLRRLPIVGRARAVDRQRLRDENNGPYVNATLDLIGLEKAEVIRRLLSPKVEVTPYPEDFDPLFTVRLERNHFAVPPIVIAGLDNVVTRHTVQRLWPDLLIDMAAGGETAQVIVKRKTEDGACVLELLAADPGEQDDVARLAAESGLAADVIRNHMDRLITASDVAAAPVEMRPALEEARRRGLLRCGFIRARALDHERSGDDFVAAAPHVVALSGTVAAAELTKELMAANQPGSLRYQFSFVSNRSRATRPPASASCDCRRSLNRAA